MMKTHDEIKMALRRFGKEVGDAYITSLANGGEQDEALEEYIYTLNGAHEYIQQLEAKIPKWTSVEEKLPISGNYLVRCVHNYCDNDGYEKYISADFVSDHEMWYGTGNLLKVTHWMPIPRVEEEHNER